MILIARLPLLLRLRAALGPPAERGRCQACGGFITIIIIIIIIIIRYSNMLLVLVLLVITINIIIISINNNITNYH